MSDIYLIVKTQLQFVEKDKFFLLWWDSGFFDKMTSAMQNVENPCSSAPFLFVGLKRVFVCLDMCYSIGTKLK
jgi:hypothetical protein